MNFAIAPATTLFRSQIQVLTYDYARPIHTPIQRERRKKSSPRANSPAVTLEWIRECESAVAAGSRWDWIAWRRRCTGDSMALQVSGKREREDFLEKIGWEKMVFWSWGFVLFVGFKNSVEAKRKQKGQNKKEKRKKRKKDGHAF